MDRGSLITISIVAGVAAIAAGIVLWKHMKKTSTTVGAEAGEVSSSVSVSKVSTVTKVTKADVKEEKKELTQPASKPTKVLKKPTFSWEAVR